MMVHRAFTIATAALAALATAPLNADVKRGVDAWSAGDFQTAVTEWQGPADGGDADALFNLAQAYRLGRGVDADINQARDLYAQAAQKGHVKAADNYGLLLFQQGEQKEAMPLIRAAADRGDPRAQYVLGLAHFNADYAERDWVRAYALLTLAQGAGLPQAVGALSQMDNYVPMNQRQEAQILARQLEEDAGKRRAAELAALDLESMRTPVSVQAAASATTSTSPPKPSLTTPAPRPAVVATPSSQSVSQPARQSARVPARVAQAAPSTTLTPVSRYTPSASRAVPVAASAKAPAAGSRATARNGSWGVQLGAFGIASNAERLWNKLSGNPALVGTHKALVPGGNITRLRAVGYASRAEASSACAKLKRQGQACIVARPAT